MKVTLGLKELEPGPWRGKVAILGRFKVSD
jgi:ribosomal protein S1